MDYAAHLQETARHLIRMVDQPAFREQAVHRVEELKAADPMYEGLLDLIAQERARMRAEATQ